MQFSSTELWQRITAAQLADTSRCREWAAEISATVDPTELADGLKTLQSLVRSGKITGYQAQILAGRTTGRLHVGRYTILGKVSHPIWKGWLEVTDSFPRELNDADQSGRLWCTLIEPNDLDGLRTSAPSLQRTQQFADLRDPALQRVLPPEVLQGKAETSAELLIAVAPVSGVPLSEACESQRQDPRRVRQIIRQVAEALARLHQANIAHGRVLPDRVLWDGTQALLVSDPFAAITAGPNPADAGILRPHLGRLSVSHFLAPEFLAPAQRPTFATDIFALGCVWWWLLTGTPPAQGRNTREIMAAGAARLPELPGDVRLSDEERLVLQHTLARNVSSRFMSARALCDAMDAAFSSEDRSESIAATAVVPGSVGATASHPTTRSPAAEAVDAVSAIQGGTDKSAEHSARATGTTATDAGHSRLGRRRRRSPPWLYVALAILGGSILLLCVLMVSGISWRNASHEQAAEAAQTAPLSADPRLENPAPADPREQHYRIVGSSGTELWLPPAAPSPPSLGLLPPGGQLFLIFHPERMLDSVSQRELLAAFDPHASDLLSMIATRAGRDPQDLKQVTVAFYPPGAADERPDMALRIDLAEPATLDELKSAWGIAAQEENDGRVLLISDAGDAYYVDEQPLVGAQNVQQYSVGPKRLMGQTAELQGAAGPLTTQIEKLWRASDHRSDLMLLASPPYLFTQGRKLLADAPQRLQDQLRQLLGVDTRAALLQMRFEPTWYCELQLIGASDRDAPAVSSALQDRLERLPGDVEAWLVAQPPHPHWRALAIRYPQMLRMLSKYARGGVENGVAITNWYLPRQAAANILLASWIAMQEGATAAERQRTESSATVPDTALTAEEYLERPIRVIFEQQPIETALQMIGEEANDSLPAGTPPIRFFLDGDAFEKAGITRNQQIRKFNHENRPLREALTEISKRGNPDPSVTDIRDENQKLIWVLSDDPLNPGSQAITLTTRAAAAAANLPCRANLTGIPHSTGYMAPAPALVQSAPTYSATKSATMVAISSGSTAPAG